MKNSSEAQLIKVSNVPMGMAQWKTLGSEHQSSSFLALKEFIDNSISASFEQRCNLDISLVENGDKIIITLEDNSGGVISPDILLTIATDSTNKLGLHNQYGYGFKNALAFFQPDWSSSDWIIQSRTDEMMSEGLMCHVEAPYVYPEEWNEVHKHYGIHAVKIDEKSFLGNCKEPGTFIQFETLSKIFFKMNPLKSGGAPIRNLKTAAEELQKLLSQWYNPKIKSGKLQININYKVNDCKKIETIYVQSGEYPVQETLKTITKQILRMENGKKMEVTAKWFEIERKSGNPFEYSAKNGLVCYVNDILVDPYIWEERVFANYANNGVMGSIVCVVEVNAKKEDAPELSVSKTKFRSNGDNYNSLIDFLEKNSPIEKIKLHANTNNSTNESVKRNQYFERLLSERELNKLETLEKESPCVLPNKKKAGENMRYDIMYIKDHTVTIMEFKRDKINTSAVFQARAYGDVATLQYPNYNIELIVVSSEISDTANSLIELYQSLNINIKFKSFADLFIG